MYERLDDFLGDVKIFSYANAIEQKYVQGRWRELSDKPLEFIIDGIESPEDLRLIRRHKIFKDDADRLEAVFLYMPREWYLATFAIDLKYEDYFVKKYNLEPMR